MATVPTKEAMAVASRTAVGSMPAALKILGFTARMYAMVMNVVIPATTSVLTLVPWVFSLKSFSSKMNQSLSIFRFGVQHYYRGAFQKNQ